MKMKSSIAFLLTFISVNFLSAQNMFSNDKCEDALQLVLNETISDTFKLLGIDSLKCDPNYTFYERGIWYKYRGNGEVIRINYTSDDNNVQLRILKGECDAFECVNYNSTSTYLLEEGVDYYFLLSQDLYRLGNTIFTFSLEELGNYAYQFCESAIELSCDSTLEININKLVPLEDGFCNSNYFNGFWLKINGDGNVKKFTWQNFPYALVNVAVGSCDSLRCQISNYAFNEFSFITIEGEVYYVLISPREITTENLFISAECLSDNRNLNCSSAETLLCDEDYNIELSRHLPFSSSKYLLQNSYLGLDKGFWYKFEDDDDISYKIKINRSNNYDNGLRFLRKLKSSSNCYDFEFLYLDLYNLDYEYRIVTDDDYDYYMMFYNFSYESVEYAFEVICEDRSQLINSCESAKEIACNEKIDFVKTNNDYVVYPDLYYSPRFQNWYNIKNVSQDITIKNNNAQTEYIDIGIFEDRCDSFILIKTYTEEIFNGKPLKIRFDDNKNYKLALGRQNQNLSFNYDIEIGCEDRIIDITSCEGAYDLSCNSNIQIETPQYVRLDLTKNGEEINNYNYRSYSYWLKFTGDGNIRNINSTNYAFFKLYKGSCDSLDLLDFNLNNNYFNPIYLKTEIGVEYFLRVVFQYNLPSNNIHIINQCYESNEADDCNGAKPISCAISPITETTIGYSQKPYSDCIKTDFPIVWYKFEGNDSLLSINANQLAGFKIFEGDCDNLICLAGFKNYLSYNTDAGKTYYIAARYGEIPEQQFNVNIDCGATRNNFSCEEATTLSCDTIVKVDFNINPSVIQEGSIQYSDLWYEILGNGKLINFSFFNDEIVSPPFNYEIYNGCDSLIFSTIINDTLDFSPFKTGFNFISEEGKKHKIRMIGYVPRKFDMKVECVDYPENTICEKATLLQCDDSIKYIPKNRMHRYGRYASYEHMAWYKLPDGKNSYKLNINDANFIVRLNLVVTDNCSDFQYFDVGRIDNSTAYFTTEVNKEYYLLLSTTMQNNTQLESTFNYKLECLGIPQNSNCENATTVQCDGAYNLNTLHSDVNSFGDCSFQAAGNWFEVIGDGRIWSFVSSINNTGYNIAYIGTGTCDNIVCEKADYISRENPLINIETAPNKKYFIKFDGFNGDLGSKVHVNCFDQSTNNSCSTSTSIICGQNYKGIVNAFIIDSTVYCNEPSFNPALYYRHVGNGDLLELQFSNSSTAQGFFVDIYEGDCAENRCLYSSYVSPLKPYVLFDTKNNTEYLLRIYSPGNNTTVVFSALCYEINENINCAGADVLTCNEEFICKSKMPLGFSLQTPCIWSSDGLPNWFLLPKSDDVMSIEKVSTNNQIYYAAIVEGNCNQYNCIYTFNNTYESFTLSNLKKDLDYYLVIINDRYATSNDLTFKLSCDEATINDICKNAETINCDSSFIAELTLATPADNFVCNQTFTSDVWYTFIGDGNILEIKNKTFNSGTIGISLISGTCENYTCLGTQVRQYYEDKPITYLSEVGKQYYLNIQGYQQPYQNIEFTTRCFEAEKNDICSGAININYSDSIDINLKQYTDDIIQGCGNYLKSGAWYTFNGNDSIISISDLPMQGFEYALFEGNCDNLVCLTSGTTYNYTYVFRAAKGKKFYLVVFGNQDNENTKLIVNWNSSIENDACQNSKTIGCNEEISFDHKEISPDLSYNCNDPSYKSVWYEFVSDTGYTTVKNIGNNYNQTLKIADGCLGSCLKSYEFYQGYPDSFSFYAKPGSKYLLNIGVSPYVNSGESKFQINCFKKHLNRYMEDAIPLECKEYNIDFSEAPPTLEYQCSITPYHSVLWYSFTGNDSLLTVYSNSPNTTLEVLDENCSYEHNFAFGGSEFQTVKNKKYFFRVNIYYSHIQNQNANFLVNFGCTTSTNEAAIDHDVKIYPNPFNQKVILDFINQNNDYLKFEIYSSSGNKIMDGIINHNEKQTIDLKTLASGIYNIKLIGNSKISNHKLIKLD